MPRERGLGSCHDIVDSVHSGCAQTLGEVRDAQPDIETWRDIVVLLALAWVVMSQARRSRTIQAQEFDFKDRHGKSRESLVVRTGLFSENMERITTLSANQRGAQIKLTARGKAFATLAGCD